MNSFQQMSGVTEVAVPQILAYHLMQLGQKYQKMAGQTYVPGNTACRWLNVDR